MNKYDIAVIQNALFSIECFFYSDSFLNCKHANFLKRNNYLPGKNYKDI